MTVKPTTIRLGTRGSALALAQSNMVRDQIIALYPDIEVELVTILTSGDWKPEDGEKRLSEAEGGKGLFAKEIERAMLADEIDIAVHSMKDMDSRETPGLIIGAMLEREDPRDALLLNPGFIAQHKLDNNSQFQIKDLPAGTRIGTSSVRRACILQSMHPDLVIEPLRGNVGTRIEKLKNGQVDATILAVAGLNRLHLSYEIFSVITKNEMTPAAAQGAVGVQCKAERENILSIIGQLNHTETQLCVEAERAALKYLDGSCHTPIGCHAMLNHGQMILSLAVYDQGDFSCYREEELQTVKDSDEAIKLGTDLAKKLKAHIPNSVFQ